MKTTQFKRSTALAVALLAMLATARAQIYVSVNNGFDGLAAVGEWNLNGTLVANPQGSMSGMDSPHGMAVSGGDLFVADTASQSIGEYTTSGTPVNTSLVTGLNGPLGLAISGSDLFVGNYSSGTIGEYNLNGTPVNASLITGLSNPNGMVISGGDLFVVNQSGTIGEYNLNGTPVNASLITGLSNPTGIGISGNYLFVSTESGTIGEYTTLGATVNASLITIPTGIDAEMAVDGSELFVNNRNGGAGGGSVAEYTLGATPGTVASSDTSFITGLYEPNGIAVVPTPEPTTLALASLGGLGVLLLRRKR